MQVCMHACIVCVFKIYEWEGGGELSVLHDIITVVVRWPGAAVIACMYVCMYVYACMNE